VLPAEGLQQGGGEVGEPALAVLRGPRVEPGGAAVEVDLPPLERPDLVDAPAGLVGEERERPDLGRQVAQDGLELVGLEETRAGRGLLEHGDVGRPVEPPLPTSRSLLSRLGRRVAVSRKTWEGAVREPEVEALMKAELLRRGYAVSRRATRTGPDIVGVRDGKSLAVRGERRSPGPREPGTINVDVMTLLGLIILRKGQGVADEYAIAIRPVHHRLVRQALPALRELKVRVFLARDDRIIEEVS
jgi:hypothetical protein